MENQFGFIADDDTAGKLGFVPDEGPTQTNDPTVDVNTFTGPKDTRGTLQKLADAHPTLRRIGQELLSAGSSPEGQKASADFFGGEWDKHPNDQTREEYINTHSHPLGEGMMKTPGVQALGESIKNKGINSGNWWGGFLGDVGSQILDLVAGTADPRAVFTKPYENPTVGRLNRIIEANDKIPHAPSSPLKQPTINRAEAGKPFTKLVIPSEDATVRSVLGPTMDANRFDTVTESVPGIPTRMERYGADEPALPYPLNVVPQRFHPTNDFFERNVPAALQERTGDVGALVSTPDELITKRILKDLPASADVKAAYDEAAGKLKPLETLPDSPIAVPVESGSITPETTPIVPESVQPEVPKSTVVSDSTASRFSDFIKRAWDDTGAVGNVAGAREARLRKLEDLKNSDEPVTDSEGRLKKLVTDEAGAIYLRGKKKSDTEEMRNGIIDAVVSRPNIGLDDLYTTVKDKISPNQFEKLLNDIMDTGDINKAIANRKAEIRSQELLAKRKELTSSVPDSPVQSLMDALGEHINARMEQDAAVTAERARRFGKVENTKGQGTEKFFAQSRQLAGEYPKMDVAKIKDALSQVDMDRLMNMVDQSELKSTMERYRAKRAVAKTLGIIDSKGALQPNEIDLLHKVFGEGLANQLLELHGFVGIPLDKSSGMAALKAGKEMNNLARTLWTSIDFSAPLKQGSGLMLNKEYWPAFKEMFKYGWSEKNYEALIEHLNTRPNAELGRKAGLYISNVITDTPSLKEEMYLSKIAEKVPGVRGSERAYTGFLDKLRSDVFDKFVKQAEEAGFKTHDVVKYTENGKPMTNIVPTQFTKDLAKYINNASGRGSLGKLGKFSDILTQAGFSPRYQASRMHMLNNFGPALLDSMKPEQFATMNPIIRKQYMKSLLAMGGMTATAMGLSGLAGHSSDLTLNPLSSDFGKGRFGDRTRLDAGASYLQWITLFSRLAMNRTTDADGKTHSLDRYNADGTIRKDEHQDVSGRLRTAGRFLRSKESPLASFIHDWVNGKDYTGKPFKYDSAIANRFIPAVIQTLTDLKDEDPELLPMFDENWIPTLNPRPTKPQLLPLMVPEILGANASVYGDRQNR